LPSIDALPGVAACGNLVSLERELAPPEDPDERATVAELREELAAVRTRLELGRGGDDERLAHIDTRARELDWPPLTAEVDVVRARVLDERGDVEGAGALALDALLLAQSAGHDRAVLDAATMLVFIEANQRGRPREAIAWGRYAEATLARLGGDSDRERNVVGMLAQAYGQAGEYERASALFEEAMAIDRDHDVPGLRAAMVLNNYAVVLQGQGRDAQSVATLRRALELVEQDLGPEHPLTGMLHANYGTALARIGRNDDAVIESRRAIAILEARRGADHPSIAAPLWTLGALLAVTRPEDAEPLLERAVRIARGRDALVAGGALAALGSLHVRTGAYESAAAELDESLAVLEGFGPMHAALVDPLFARGELERRRHDPAAALAALDRARAIAVADPGVGADRVAEIDSERARALIELGEAVRAD
jgi:tetratricopeptide (TPR) repeat protein